MYQWSLCELECRPHSKLQCTGIQTADYCEVIVLMSPYVSVDQYKVTKHKPKHFVYNIFVQHMGVWTYQNELIVCKLFITTVRCGSCIDTVVVIRGVTTDPQPVTTVTTEVIVSTRLRE